MNRGLIVGRIFSPSGKGAGGAFVTVTRVYGSGGLLGIQKIDGKVRSNGQYAVPFLWSGTEFADDLSSLKTTAIVVARTESVTKSGRVTTWTTTAGARAEVTCVIMRDSMGQLATVANTFGSIPEIADSALSLASALANYKNLVPFWKTSLWTTENWLMVGAQDIYLI